MASFNPAGAVVHFTLILKLTELCAYSILCLKSSCAPPSGALQNWTH
jgi:hypothetical protein